MLYIVTALYEEALPFLQKFNLKRRTDFSHFELFASESILLLITRPGALRAAAALSALLTAFPPRRYDFLLSIGCAGCSCAVDPAPDTERSHAVLPPGQDTPYCPAPAIGQAFTICKITDAASGRTRYPELLYRSPFAEAEVITVPSVQTKAHACAGPKTTLPSADSADTPCVRYGACAETTFSIPPAPVLYDMEAAGVYEAAIVYLSCDRILFVKVISDALTGLSGLSAEDRRTHVTECIAGVVAPLTEWLDRVMAALRPSLPNDISLRSGAAALPYQADPLPCAREAVQTLPGVFTAQEEALFSEICTALRLSAASGCKLRQLMLYLSLSGIPYTDSMRQQLAAPLAAPCRTKKEGLKYLEQLTEYYL